MIAKRVTGVLVGVAAVAAASFAVAAGGSQQADDYVVRAVFDNSSFVIAGEDVKVDGVKAGEIVGLDLTADNKAVVVLRITDPAFKPFRTDAQCRVGLQSLIGEQFVECKPTLPRGDGVAPAKPLPEITKGPGVGQHLLGVGNTTTPVGLDLLNNIMRVPQRERLGLIVNELGAGLAGNGERLREAIVRANPALKQADKLVATLADQDRVLGRLVDASDEVLAPMAAHRKQLGGFVEHAGTVAAAAAERGDDLERDLQKLPGFLRELRPAAQRFGALADQMGPAVEVLADQAPAVNSATDRLGPLSASATPALESLGQLASRGRKTFPRIESLADQLRSVSKPVKPLAGNLAALSGSFDNANGIEELMRFIYFYTGSVNGQDSLGHYLRAGLQLGNCSQRVKELSPGCESNFATPAAAATATAAAAPATPRSFAALPATGGATGVNTGLLDYLLGSATTR